MSFQDVLENREGRPWTGWTDGIWQLGTPLTDPEWEQSAVIAVWARILMLDDGSVEEHSGWETCPETWVQVDAEVALQAGISDMT